MRRLKYSFVIVILVAVFTNCKPKPSPITYGLDGCQYCSMTIVDRQHAAELVTAKGKVFKFDSVECLLNYKIEQESDENALYLCNHYDTPSELIKVQDAKFLISEGIPSPMGAYLTAFESEELAMDIIENHGGTLYNWQELNIYWEKNGYVYH